MNYHKTPCSTPKKILVITNNNLLIQNTTSCLSQLDPFYELLAATNGNMGCKLAQKILPDLIMLDWKINALDSIKTLRQQVATRLIPILIIIEKSIEHNQALAQTLEFGGIDCIASPLQSKNQCCPKFCRSIPTR